MKSKTKVADLSYEQFVEQYPDFDNPIKVYALACNRGGYLDSLEDTKERSDTRFYFEWDDWLVCTDEEANEEHVAYIKSLVDDMGFDAFNQNSVSLTVEADAYGDVIVSKSILIPENERGSSLNHYDGNEYNISVNDTTYYIYQK